MLFLAVLGSSASSLQTTFIPAARTMLAMSVYKALPKKLSEINPHYGIPSYATLVSGIGTAIFYTVMSLVSENVLVDTILSLGLMICFYYGLTAFAATYYFRHEATRNVKSFLLKGVAPLAGGLALAAIFVQLVIDTTDPAYGSGGSIFGLGHGLRARRRRPVARRRLHVFLAGARTGVLPRRGAQARHAAAGRRRLNSQFRSHPAG